ncbi:MAG: YihY/virulence factor BrkB family protein [Daejeonella sp.]|uniref:YihY/virulence factor BrkB family protein n=1 Tax=Daejeonella sp. JGW-45 TaxID=3034148 RepID=UPI0023EE1030|nr:YihY/virulence factor BrkB family protein [Daejeonella sp. JGW-45]
MKQKDRFSIRNSGQLLYRSFNAFLDDNALKMSASLAYYTTFAIAPLLLIIVSLAGIIYGQEAAQGKVFAELNKFVGADAANQIQETIKNISESQESTLAIIIGFATLFIGTTGVFIEIQDSINHIWRVKAKPKKGWIKLITNRVLSFSMVIGLGFLLIVSLVINGLVLALSAKLQIYFPDVAILFVNIFNLILTFIVISALFGIIFKYLPDVQIGWKDVRMGAFFTATLFMLGKFLIGLYIEQVGPGSAYGAAGSLIVILIWVYYTASILFFGAEFTQVYADCYGGKIKPAEYAVHVLQVEEEKKVAVLPAQDHDKTYEGTEKVKK